MINDMVVQPGIYSEMVAVELLKAYCLPLLLYASESVSLIPSQLHELNNCINRAVFKLFGVSNGHTVKDTYRILLVWVMWLK